MDDLDIFLNHGLKDQLEMNERVEADDGYSGADPRYVKSRSGVCHKNKTVRNTVRARHEIGNKRIKQFKVLSDVYRHDIKNHRIVFESVVVLTQLSLKYKPLFEIENYF